MPAKKDPRIDAYVAKAAPFAQPSHKREHIEWTAEGKQRHWKYQNC